MYHAEIGLFSEPLIDYLKYRGWILMESEPDIAVLRKIFNDQEEEIVLPRDRTFADYRQRIMEAIQFLAKHEHSSEKKILNELLLQKWDVLRISISGDHIGAGCISYFDKGIIEAGVRKVLLASARYVLDPKSYFKRLYSTSVEQWMKRCRAGTAESGSYILTIQMPLQENLDDLEVPFSRRVSEYLMASLNQLVELIQQSDVLAEKAEPHLNANLCLGLVEMKPDETPIHAESIYSYFWHSLRKTSLFRTQGCFSL